MVRRCPPADGARTGVRALTACLKSRRPAPHACALAGGGAADLGPALAAPSFAEKTTPELLVKRQGRQAASMPQFVRNASSSAPAGARKPLFSRQPRGEGAATITAAAAKPLPHVGRENFQQPPAPSGMGGAVSDWPCSAGGASALWAGGLQPAWAAAQVLGGSCMLGSLAGGAGPRFAARTSPRNGRRGLTRAHRHG
jgi:hypothetical protein